MWKNVLFDLRALNTYFCLAFTLDADASFVFALKTFFVRVIFV